MFDYTDLLLAMGAMVIYSLLLMNTTMSMLQSDTRQVEIELEHTAISLAQSLIDESRTKPFTGGEEVSGQLLHGLLNLPLAAFNDLNGYTRTDTTAHGSFETSVEVFYVERDAPDTPAGFETDYQRMNVEVISDYFEHSITLSFIKSRY